MIFEAFQQGNKRYTDNEHNTDPLEIVVRVLSQCQAERTKQAR